MYSQRVVQASIEQLEKSLYLKLRRYTLTEIDDFAYRMKDVDWSLAPTSTIIATLPEEIQKYILNELQLSKVDWLYWANRYAYITDDKGRNVPLKLWTSQKLLLDILSKEEEKAWDLYQRDPEQRELLCKVALILLKSRQVGGTIISEVLLAHLVLFFHHTRAVIASDHPDNSLKLFRVFTNVVDNLPMWMKPVVSDRVKATNMHFPTLNGDVSVGSGNQKTTFGQGMTVDAAHLTEVSTWGPVNADGIDADLKPAFNSSRKHHSLFILESTGAGGQGNWFHDQYKATREGKGLFKHLFIGWFRCADKFSLPTEGVEIGETAKAVAARIERDNNITITKGQMAWYQVMREEFESRGRLETFFQEYPSSPEEAFQFGLKSVFSLDSIDKTRNLMREPIFVGNWRSDTRKFKQLSLKEWNEEVGVEKHTNRLVIWELPKPGHIYVVACDTAYGLDGGDSSAIEVVRVGNRWLPDEQVAEWKGNFRPSALADIVWNIGHLYADKVDGFPAKVAIECQPGSPGTVPQLDLQRRGYPHFYIYKRPLRVGGGGWSKEVGWWTTGITRTPLTEGGVNVVEKGELKVNSPVVIEEMRSYVYRYTNQGDRRLDHAPGYHDDALLALFIAYYVAHESDTRNIADDRRKDHEKKGMPKEKVIQFQDLAASWVPGMDWEKAVGRWEEELDQPQ
jgi:hypothetical protein